MIISIFYEIFENLDIDKTKNKNFMAELIYGYILFNKFSKKIKKYYFSFFINIKD